MADRPTTSVDGDVLSASVSEQHRTPEGDVWLKYEASVRVLPGESIESANMRLETTLVTGLLSLRDTDEEELRNG